MKLLKPNIYAFEAEIVLTFCHVVSSILAQDIVRTRRHAKQKAQTM
jgi:hypothetical protein